MLEPDWKTHFSITAGTTHWWILREFHPVIFRFGRNFSRPTVHCFFKVGNAPVSS